MDQLSDASPVICYRLKVIGRAQTTDYPPGRRPYGPEADLCSVVSGPDNRELITINLRATLAATGTPLAAEWHCYNGAYHGYRSSSFGWVVVGHSQSCRPAYREDGDGTGPTSSHHWA